MEAEKDNARKPYEKPRVRPVDLVVEEIMGVCKISPATSGPHQFTCANCAMTFGGS